MKKLLGVLLLTGVALSANHAFCNDTNNESLQSLLTQFESNIDQLKNYYMTNTTNKNFNEASKQYFSTLKLYHQLEYTQTPYTEDQYADYIHLKIWLSRITRALNYYFEKCFVRPEARISYNTPVTAVQLLTKPAQQRYSPYTEESPIWPSFHPDKYRNSQIPNLIKNNTKYIAAGVVLGAVAIAGITYLIVKHRHSIVRYIKQTGQKIKNRFKKTDKNSQTKDTQELTDIPKVALN